MLLSFLFCALVHGWSVNVKVKLAGDFSHIVQDLGSPIGRITSLLKPWDRTLVALKPFVTPRETFKILHAYYFALAHLFFGFTKCHISVSY